MTAHATPPRRTPRRPHLRLRSLWLAALGWMALAPAPAAAQQLPQVPVPPENPITEPKRVLGKILFWEEQLSSDNSTACGSCHSPEMGGSDPRAPAHPGPDRVFGTDDDVIGSLGVRRSDAENQRVRDPVFGFAAQVTGRTAPSYFGMSAFAPELFWDGRAASRFEDPESGAIAIVGGGALESQAVGPILSDVEMAHEGRTWADVRDKLERVRPLALASRVPADMAAALGADGSYPELFAAAYGDPQITAERIAFAIATYERTLIPDRTPWDRFMAGEAGALSEQQEQGWELLEEHTVCFNYHVPPQFTDHLYYNIGLRPASEDLGRQDVTHAGTDAGRFRTPTLRNSGLKPALMHVGWIVDVEDSIDFYNAGSGQAVTGHVQFTADQSGIPTANPGVLADYDSIFMPEITQGGQAFQGPVIDFLTNGLTDPRVAAEQFPFDRPTLRGARGLCDDGLDNDGNGLTDHPQDPACTSPGDNGERDTGPPAPVDCLEDAETLCLQQERFRVEVEWRDFQDNTGTGQVVLKSQDSGLFWFFDPDNWEMMVKVLSGCGFNDRFWVFASATTNVEYTLRVTDTETGVTREYVNPLGTSAPAITDTNAFAICP